MTAPSPIARIWLTYKTRIVSERRYQSYAIVSHIALSWYAFLTIGFSIYQDRFALYLGAGGANQASLIMSVLTFGLSLIIYGFKFDDAARMQRDCYLKMQSIYQSSEAIDVKLESYRMLLEHYPNHADRDYRQVLFDAWEAGRILTDTEGNPIKFGILNIVACYLRGAAWYGFLILIFAMPSALGLFWILAT